MAANIMYKYNQIKQNVLTNLCTLICFLVLYLSTNLIMIKKTNFSNVRFFDITNL